MVMAVPAGTAARRGCGCPGAGDGSRVVRVPAGSCPAGEEDRWRGGAGVRGRTWGGRKHAGAEVGGVRFHRSAAGLCDYLPDPVAGGAAVGAVRDAQAMMALAEAGQRLRGGCAGLGTASQRVGRGGRPQPGGVGGAGRVVRREVGALEGKGQAGEGFGRCFAAEGRRGAR
jgi:hypothetical protein